MDSHVRVAVIGGGVVGCSILYHLARSGWSDVALLERSELAAGSSWHAAGGMHTLNSDPNVARLQKYTIKLYQEIQELSGQACGVHTTGGVMLAGSDSRMDFIKSTVAKRRYLDLDSQVLSVDEAFEHCPIMDKSFFLGGLYEPYEGHLDPAGVTTAYAKAAQKLGAKVHLRNRVMDLVPLNDGWQVVTEHGTITAEHVVNAGGLWAREVGRMVGLELPLLAMEHHYLVTEDIPELEGLELHVIDFEGEIYMRSEGKGLLVGTYEKAATPWSPKTTPWDFGFELLESKLDRIAPSLDIGFKHFPCLQRAGIKRVINGPFTFAPDGNPLVGPVRGLRNFWSACAVMAGFSQAGGVGLVLSNWITEGDPGMDVMAMDVARFGNWASMGYTHAKVCENYARRFSITFPNEELPAGRPLRTSPIYGHMRQANAVFGAAYGLEVPLWFAPQGQEAVETVSYHRSNAFGPVGEEVQAVRERVGLMEISAFAKYRVTGADSRPWLDGLFAGRIPKPGRIALCPLLSPLGKIIGDLTIACLDDTTFYLFGSGLAEHYHMRWFEAHTQGRNVQIQPLGLQVCGLSIAGPNARALLKKLAPDGDMNFMDFKPLDIGLIPALVGRLSFTGDLGYEIWVDSDHLVALYDSLLDAGQEFGLRCFGSRALNALRLEKGFGGWMREYRPDYDAHESGLVRFIFPDKGDFIGREAFLKQQKAPQKRLMMFAVNSNDPSFEADPIADEPISLDGEVVGWVTSGGYAYTPQTSVALGYVKTPHHQARAGFSVEILGKTMPMTALDAPLFDPSGARMRA